MNTLPLSFELKRGCDALGLPFAVAIELISYLATQTTSPEARSAFSPSAKIDELLHWILLNTDTRLIVEKFLGTIHHSTQSSTYDEAAKSQRRYCSTSSEFLMKASDFFV